MIQLLVVAAAFALLPLMTGKLKMKISLAIFISSALIQVIALHSFQTLWTVIQAVFSLSNLNAVASIVLIGVLSGLMKHYGMLEDIVEAAKLLIHSRRVLLGLIPAVIGLLSVPGGAYMSAPFVNSLGEEMNISKARRAAINLTFRHTAMFLSPLSTFQVYIASCVAVSTYTMILLFVPFVAAMVVGSVLLYMPRGREKRQDAERKKTNTAAFKRLGRGIAPIICVLLANGLLHLPMSLALLLSLGITWLLNPTKGFLCLAVGNVKFDVALMIISVYFAQHTVLALSDMQQIMTQAFAGGGTVVMMLVVMGNALFLGAITGLYYLTLGMFLPIAAGLASGSAALPLMFFVCIWAFMGYFYSPLHLCQLLTMRCMEVKSREVYREHLRLAVWLAPLTIVLYFVYSLIL